MNRRRIRCLQRILRPALSQRLHAARYLQQHATGHLSSNLLLQRRPMACEAVLLCRTSLKVSSMVGADNTQEFVGRLPLSLVWLLNLSVLNGLWIRYFELTCRN